MRLALIWLLTAAALVAGDPPVPQIFFGHPMGADKSSLEWSKVLKYFDQLDDASDRVSLKKIGKTTQGKDMIAAFISDPATLKSLDQYRQIQEKLADPRLLQEGDADRFLTRGKTVVMITCSIHSTEVASTHSAIELAYRLATANDVKTRAILDHTILILVPSLNPDGIDIVTDWYRRTLGTSYEGTSPPSLYQKYVGHDNNRDWYIFSQAETRNVISQLHNVWHPQIVYDVHEQGPYASRMFVPPWLDPIDPNVDPILAQMANAVGMNMAFDLTAAGKKGVAVNALYDFWTPARHYQSYHGGIRILSESATTRLGTPIEIKPDQIGKAALGYDPRQSSWNYLEPWNGGIWHLRDIVDYQLIAMESCLYQAATRREDFLRAFLQVARKAVSQQLPFAFVISKDQRDPGATYQLLETLAFGAVDIEESADNFNAGGKLFPQGSWIVRLQQPYGAFAKTLLERQQYPDLRLYPGGPPRRPYDVTAQTLPLLMGVDVTTVTEPFTIKTKPAKLVSEFRNRGALPAANSNSWKAVFRAWHENKKVWRDPQSGDFLVADKAPNGYQGMLPVRVGIYKSFIPSMDEGWTRWTLDTFGLPYRSVSNIEIQQGGLNKNLDVLLFPDQADRQIESGFKEGSMPREYTGGLGDVGAASLREFVQNGGRLIFLNDSLEYAIRRLQLPVKLSTDGVDSKDFYSPGSLLNVKKAAPSTFTLGLPDQFAIWSEQSPGLEPGDGATAILTYPADKILASGWLLGEKYLAGRAAMVEVKLGKGDVVLFAMRPQYRAQSYLTFKLLFNALAY